MNAETQKVIDAAVAAELQRLLDMPEPRDVWVAIARRIRDLDPS